MTAASVRAAAKRQVVGAALSVADDVAKNNLDPIDLEAAAVEECRRLFASVVGPGDPLWELHVAVARQVLALDGVPGDELAEWLAVTRQAEVAAGKVEPSWIEQTLAELDEDEDDGGESEPRSLLTETNDLPVSDL